MALHTAHRLNATHDSLNLLNEEVYHMRKLALQNHMALDMLTVSQGGVCALVGQNAVYMFLMSIIMLVKHYGHQLLRPMPMNA